eukprot:scaffold374565_cov16-Prasinocladus_malaysianus.AAC.1
MGFGRTHTCTSSWLARTIISFAFIRIDQRWHVEDRSARWHHGDYGAQCRLARTLDGLLILPSIARTYR